MSQAFTTYWKPDGWARLALGDPILYAAGSGFLKRGVVKGSRIYVMNVANGEVRLLGSFTVDTVANTEQAKALGMEPRDAREHLIAEDGTATPFQIRPLPLDMARALEFVRDGKKSVLIFKPSGGVDGQTLRGIRELEETSAALLDSLLIGSAVTPTRMSDGSDAAMEPHPLYEDDGRQVKARFLISLDDDRVNVIVESRGGAIGTANERNSEYGLALRLIVSRLADASIGIDDATVESSELLRRGLTKVQRRVQGLSFPMALSKTADAYAIALALQRGQKSVGSESEAGGGNTTRRLLLTLAAHGLSADALSDLLGAGSNAGDTPLPLGPDFGATTKGDFNPNGMTDARRRVLACLAQRQGQPGFRRELLEAYDNKCAITGCDLSAALEAAHIVPYWGPHTNHVQNGLLLRSDLHTLFDRGVFGIDPATWQVKSNGSLKGTHYEWLEGAQLTPPKESSSAPSELALRLHLQTLSGA